MELRKIGGEACRSPVLTPDLVDLWGAVIAKFRKIEGGACRSPVPHCELVDLWGAVVVELPKIALMDGDQ